MEKEKALELRSLGRPFAPAKFKEWYGEDFDYMKVREYRKGLVEEMISKTGIALKPGAKEILTWLRENNILTSLATANDYERTERYLKKIGLFEYFDKIICANMVKQGKPAPDIYAYACKQLGLSPDRTFAVEDSPNGVTSAYRAGCKVIMIPDLTQPDEELQKMLYKKLDSLGKIKELFS
jgi:DNA helicase-2/ATP-dependent DNA helicase PcrA